MNIKERLEGMYPNSTVVELAVNGVTFYSMANRSSGTVDVYAVTGERVACAEFDDEMEAVYYDYAINPEDGEGKDGASTSLYHEHDGKMEHDLAVDLGTYLATISFE